MSQNEKPPYLSFACEHPGCSYTGQERSVKEHFRAQHLQMKEYKCWHCSYRTSYKDRLDNHVKSEHKRCSQTDPCKNGNHKDCQFNVSPQKKK